MAASTICIYWFLLYLLVYVISTDLYCFYIYHANLYVHDPECVEAIQAFLDTYVQL